MSEIVCIVLIDVGCRFEHKIHQEVSIILIDGEELKEALFSFRLEFGVSKSVEELN
jgi:hypothetical protein